MSFKTFNFNLIVSYFLRVKLIDFWLKSTVWQFIILLSSSCLCNRCLFSFQFFFQLLRKCLTLMRCIFRSQIFKLFLNKSLRFEGALFFLLLLNFSNKLFFASLAIVVLMSFNYWERWRNFFRNYIDFRLESTFSVNFSLRLLLFYLLLWLVHSKKSLKSVSFWLRASRWISSAYHFTRQVNLGFKFELGFFWVLIS